MMNRLVIIKITTTIIIAYPNTVSPVPGNYLITLCNAISLVIHNNPIGKG